MPGLWICQGYTALQRRLNMSQQCLNIPKYARIVKSVLVVAVYIRYPSILRTWCIFRTLSEIYDCPDHSGFCVTLEYSEFEAFS